MELLSKENLSGVRGYKGHRSKVKMGVEVMRGGPSHYYVGCGTAEARELGVRGHPGLHTETHVNLGVNFCSDSGRDSQEGFAGWGWGQHCWESKGRGKGQKSHLGSASRVTDRNQRPHWGTEGHSLSSRVRLESTKKRSHRSHTTEGKGQTVGSETGSNYVGQASSNSVFRVLG